MQHPWGVHVLGVPRLRSAAGTTQTLERKASALLAYVAVEGPTPRSTLAGLLWPGVVDGSARNNLRQLLHRLRAYDGLLDGSSDVRLGGAVRVDVAELRGLQEQGDTRAIADGWGAEAVELLRGQDFSDCPDLAEWVTAERARASDTVARAVEAEAEREEAAGDLSGALARAMRLLELEPLSEAAYRRAMRLHYLLGDRARALDVYHRCQAVLSETFGVAPLSDTEELARAIDAGTAERPVAAAAPELPVALRRPPRLVGRERAWERLERAWERCSTLIVTGEAGIGKSSLIHAFARSRGDTLVTHGVSGERTVPYAAKARTLRAILSARPEIAAETWIRAELARILPGMFEPPAHQEAIVDASQKLRLFEAAATVYERALQGKTALINEDLHLWDEASFEMGSYFVSRLANTGVHALISVRPTELGGERMQEFERAADTGLAEIVELEPLDLDDVAALVGDVGADLSVPPTELLQLSGGNPFYALEFLRSRWQERTAAGPARDGEASSRAGVLEARLRRLSRPALDLLRVRAVAGTAFSPELAAAVMEAPAVEVRSALDELHRQRLLSGEDEAHELVSEAVTRRTPPEARRLWHRRVAVQMAAFGSGAAAVAAQYLAAWEPAAAYPYLLRAGGEAAAVHALDEARSWFLRAVWAATDDRQRADALLGLDDVAGQRAPVEEADAVLDALEALAGRLGQPALPVEIAIRRARSLTRRGDHAAAASLAREAYDDARRLDDDDRAQRARLTLGDLAYLGGRYDEARSHYTAAAESSTEPRRLRALQRLGALEGMRGDVRAAVEHHRQALALARRRNDLPLVATLLNSVGADTERLGDYAAASRDFQRAGEAARRVGDRRTGAIALSNAALTQANLGELATALATAGRALEVARPLGVDRSAAMARFVHGYASRRLGRASAARDDLAEAVRLREAANDVRGALVARFNLAAMDLEEGAAAEDGAEAVVGELEALRIPQFLAWCLVELAFLTPDPERARARLERALALERGAHLRLAAETAALRAALLAGEPDEVRRRRRRLRERMQRGAYLETSLAHLLLARSAGRPAGERASMAAARSRVALEVGRLGEAALRGRLAYLERRVPARA